MDAKVAVVWAGGEHVMGGCGKWVVVRSVCVI